METGQSWERRSRTICSTACIARVDTRRACSSPFSGLLRPTPTAACSAGCGRDIGPSRGAGRERIRSGLHCALSAEDSQGLRDRAQCVDRAPWRRLSPPRDLLYRLNMDSKARMHDVVALLEEV